MIRPLRLPVLALALFVCLPAIASAGTPHSAIFFYPWYSGLCALDAGRASAALRSRVAVLPCPRAVLER